MKGHRWSGVEGTVTVEVLFVPDNRKWWQRLFRKPDEDVGWWDISNETAASPVLVAAIRSLFPTGNEFQVEVDFESSGSYEPAHISRYPENDHPEEHDEERTLVRVFVSPGFAGERGYREQEGKSLPMDVADQVFALYYDDVLETELEYDDGGPDYDDRDE